MWTRAPDGSLRQVTQFGSFSQIEALGPDGPVVLANGTRGYLATASGAPIDVGSTQGTVSWSDDRFAVRLGNTVFSLSP